MSTKSAFTLDVDYSPKDTFRVVQLTPLVSGCSIHVGRALTDAPAGSVRNIYLMVSDIDAARRAVVERGVEVSAIRHKASGSLGWGFRTGLDTAHGGYASFSDPDGNIWVL